MGDLIQPARPTPYSAALASTGTIIGPNWQQSFYPHFDAFLSATRSIGQVIKCCFGEDRHSALKPFNTLPPEEQDRRRDFQNQFDSHLGDISVHRAGYAPVTVATISLLGVKYEGSATKRIPDAEIRHVNEAGPFVQSDLFQSCQCGRLLYRWEASVR